MESNSINGNLSGIIKVTYEPPYNSFGPSKPKLVFEYDYSTGNYSYSYDELCQDDIEGIISFLEATSNIDFFFKLPEVNEGVHDSKEYLTIEYNGEEKTIAQNVLKPIFHHPFNISSITIKSAVMEKDNWDNIFEFNNDPNVNKLRNLYATPSWFEILGVDRIEALHSNFIEWLLRNKSLGINQSDNAVTRFIDVVIKQSKSQKAKGIDKDLINSIAARDIVIKDVNVDKEVSYKDTKSDNRIDLIVTCDICVNNEDKELVLYIENKVGANETFNKKSNKFQTQVYYDQYHDDSEPNLIQLFVFLSPYNNAICDCNDFIRITYKDLLMYVLEPTINVPNISKHDRLFIIEYIRTLGAQVLNHQDMGLVMAITDDEKKAYSEIYEKYRLLFLESMAAKISERYRNSSPSTKKTHSENMKKWGLTFSEEPDKQLVAFWNSNCAFIKNTIVIAGPKDKNELVNEINLILKDRTEFTVKYTGIKTKVNKSHLAAEVVKAYIKMNNLNENDLDKLKDSFRGIRKPFIIEGEPKKNSRNIYDKVILGSKTIWIPNNCWSAGSRHFEKLLNVANKIDGLILD